MGIFVADEKLNVVKDSLRVGRNTKGSSRGLSVDLGDGACKWTELMREVPEELDLWKTLLVGFPSGDKRMAWVQMEALSGLPSKDDWDFVFNGYSNAPFIKTNYPHPSAVWSWDSEADQVALVLQFICRSMTSTPGVTRMPSSKSTSMDGTSTSIWRMAITVILKTDRVTICHRTFSATNPSVEIRIPDSYVELHRDHGDFIGTCEDAMKDPNFMNGHINPPNCGADTQDLNCDKITNSCRPVTIISADRLRDFTEGPKETEIIGDLAVHLDRGHRKQGTNDFDDRDISSDPNFSEFMLQEMLGEVCRLVDKYSADLWTDDINANRLVLLLSEHIPLLQTKIDSLLSGSCTLSVKDILGPGEGGSFWQKYCVKVLNGGVRGL
ncbi:hypothetical protein ACHAWO_009908 [Cyclotella atomus]|uniref:Uncharacterized protein n=1 Tax=Cyclotella atomus TaxID=382360 RepID=A0ABD3NT71_9STRA